MQRCHLVSTSAATEFGMREDLTFYEQHYGCQLFLMNRLSWTELEHLCFIDFWSDTLIPYARFCTRKPVWSSCLCHCVWWLSLVLLLKSSLHSQETWIQQVSSSIQLSIANAGLIVQTMTSTKGYSDANIKTWEIPPSFAAKQQVTRLFYWQFSSWILCINYSHDINSWNKMKTIVI